MLTGGYFQYLVLVNTILYKASKVIAEISAKENFKPVMEKLKNIRENKIGKRLNRGLRNMSFRRVQFYISYKSMENGFKHKIVTPRNTFKTCSMCSELNKSNGHIYKCKKCGFQVDRQLATAWNIAAKLSMWDVLLFP